MNIHYHNAPIRKSIIRALVAIIFFSISFTMAAQYEPGEREWEIDSTQVDNLNLRINSTLFFQDNEFDCPFMRGYTLPGFKLRPAVEYTPSRHVKAELGIYMFKFWGTDNYPNLAYTDISEWTGKENATKGLHLLPFFRVQMSTNENLNIVIGSIYGGRYHHLLEPLYAPELNLTADPETGAQVLFANKWIDLDVWVNWQSFIYKNDTHQEAFTFGTSAKFKYNSPEKKVHFYSPLQILFQHRGGEIDTIYHNSVQTLFNGATGFGAKFDIRHRAIKTLTLEADAMVYNQQVGNIWPFDSGWAYFLHATMDVSKVRAKLGYMESHKFISLFGYPFFGCVSTSNEGLTFDRNSTLFAGVEYSHEFYPGYTLGASAMVYRHMPGTGLLDGEAKHYDPSTSFFGAIFFRLNPAFLLKSFKKDKKKEPAAL